jgi:DNA polymerase III subunit epsilon
MRQIALDTETTGLSTERGHRIIEIGCVEMLHRKITGNTFHCYIDPEREIEAAAFAVHGISNDFLQNKPTFTHVMKSLLEFIVSSELIIHNAPFDVGFLNYELSLARHPKMIHEYCSVFDTLVFARQRHPGQKNSLDALCDRYEIDNSHREFHGALLDADLLARIYLAMTGGQGSLFSDAQSSSHAEGLYDVLDLPVRSKPLPVAMLTDQDRQAHLDFVELLKRKAGASLWEE